MSKPHILHMLSPLKHVSPFDVNMALDAGFDVTIPYTQVTTQEVTGLVQDAIFSRAPQDGVRTGIFIGGKNAVVALDMMASATAALVPPFAVSIFADPAGSFTTAAAMVAFVERVLAERFHRDLQNVDVKVFGGTGVVAFSAAVILGQAGARATLVGHDGRKRVAAAAAEIQRRFGVTVESADGSSEDLKAELAHDAEVILCAGPAAVQILSRRQLEGATRLLIAADLNAVPPPGIEGLSPTERATPLGFGQAVGIGALAIGDLKYRTEAALFRRMIEAEAPVAYDFRDAFKLARELAAA